MELLLEKIAKLAKNGVFGEGEFVRVIPNSDAEMAPQFASELGFFVVELEKGSEIVREPVVVKIQPKDQAARLMQNSDDQFFVEVAMYSEVLPFLGANEMDVFPKFFYGVSSRGVNPEDDIIILEDVSSQGFITAPEIFLNADVIKVTMRKLGEFHGYSYKAKKTRLSQTQDLGRTLPRNKVEDIEGINKHIWDRGFNAAKKRCDAPQLLDQVRSKMDKYGLDGIWALLQGSPKEPFAAIIHGDFNRNNLMFKYVNNKVEKVIFLDFQTSLYSDPAVDIAFFLYMNSSQETRNDHWDDFFKTYWEGVVSVEPNPGFSYEEFLNNFASRALYGYLPCSFFLPTMLDTEKIEIGEFLAWTPEKKLDAMANAGGEKGEKALADILLDMLHRGFLAAFLNTE